MPLDQVQQRRMVHGHTFRPTGATAGEEHVGQVLRLRRAEIFEQRSVHQVDVLDEEHLGGGAGEEVLMGLVGDHHWRPGILHHQGDAFGGVGGVDGDVCGAGLQDAEDADDQFGGAFQADADRATGGHALGLKAMRQAVHSKGEGLVVNGPVMEDQ